MNNQNQPLEAIQDIRRMMERSSRFISLSGWSGIAAGVCALIGAVAAHNLIKEYRLGHGTDYNELIVADIFSLDSEHLISQLLLLAIIVLLAAIILAFVFTYIRSKRNGTALWDNTARRLMWNTIMPMVIGGVCILRVLQIGEFSLVAPLCLVFYGLALINASKYTLGEVRYLGYGQVLLGLFNLWLPGYGLYFWAAGFGLLHIIYGSLMWWKYER